jgi:hypothetical protein
MGVDASCSDCKTPLVNDTITLDNGSVVQVSKCIDCQGKIKSPMCCGKDMQHSN